MAQYELVFSGQLVDGFDLVQVKQNVANLFKASPAQVEQMFSGRSVVLRNRLDEATGNKYLAILKKNGAQCELRMMGQPAPEAASPAPSAQAPSAAQPSAAPVAAKPGSAGVQSPPGALPVAGEKVDDILHDISWDVAPAGVQLGEGSEEIPVAEPDTSHLSLAPAGSDMGQKKAPPPPPAPDTSHIKLDN